jgi:hypothetical protein
VRCPGSPREEANYPDETNQYATDGTHSHTLLEKATDLVVENGNNRVDVFTSFNGKVLKDHEGEFKVDKARCERVQIAVDYICKKMKEVDCYVRSESRTNSFIAFTRPDLSGTLDLLLHSESYLEIVDYKDGVGYVSPVENYQLMIYALSKFKEDHHSMYKDVKNIVVTIVQPKNKMKGRDPVQSWVFPVSEVNHWIKFFREKAAETDDPSAPLVPGEHCHFCKHRVNCEERRKFVMEKADIQEIKFLPDIIDQAAEKDTSKINTEKLREINQAAPLIKSFLDDAATELFKRTESGENTGFKIVTGRGSRSWSRPEEEVVEALKKMGVPKTDVYEIKLVSPAKAEKLSWVKKVKGEDVQTTLSKKQIEALIKDYVSHVEGKPTLAPIDDPRPSIAQDATSLFAPVIEQKKETLPTWLTGGI